MIASLGLSGAETVGFLEASALFAQSVTEVHGYHRRGPGASPRPGHGDDARGAGHAAREAARRAGQGRPGRTAFWGELVTSSLPKQAVSGIGGKLGARSFKRFLTRQGTSVLGRAIPFGIGAVVGGLGNHALGRRSSSPPAVRSGRRPCTSPSCSRPGRCRGDGREAAEQAAAARPGPRSRPLTRTAPPTDGRPATSWWRASRPSVDRPVTGGCGGSSGRGRGRGHRAASAVCQCRRTAW